MHVHVPVMSQQHFHSTPMFPEVPMPSLRNTRNSDLGHFFRERPHSTSMQQPRDQYGWRYHTSNASGTNILPSHAQPTPSILASKFPPICRYVERGPIRARRYQMPGSRTSGIQHKDNSQITLQERSNMQTQQSDQASECGQATSEQQSKKLKPMKLQFYKTKKCPWVQAGATCRRGANCRWAHCEEELRPLPDLTKTKMCETFLLTGYCGQGSSCKYAHGGEELRATESFVKTKLCKMWQEGCCTAEGSCRFAHGDTELRSTAVVSQAPGDPLISASSIADANGPASGSPIKRGYPTTYLNFEQLQTPSPGNDLEITNTFSGAKPSSALARSKKDGMKMVPRLDLRSPAQSPDGTFVDCDVQPLNEISDPNLLDPEMVEDLLLIAAVSSFAANSTLKASKMNPNVCLGSTLPAHMLPGPSKAPTVMSENWQNFLDASINQSSTVTSSLAPEERHRCSINNVNGSTSPDIFDFSMKNATDNCFPSENDGMSCGSTQRLANHLLPSGILSPTPSNKNRWTNQVVASQWTNRWTNMPSFTLRNKETDEVRAAEHLPAMVSSSGAPHPNLPCSSSSSPRLHISLDHAGTPPLQGSHSTRMRSKDNGFVKNFPLEKPNHLQPASDGVCRSETAPSPRSKDYSGCSKGLNQPQEPSQESPSIDNANRTVGPCSDIFEKMLPLVLSSETQSPIRKNTDSRNGVEEAFNAIGMTHALAGISDENTILYLNDDPNATVPPWLIFDQLRQARGDHIFATSGGTDLMFPPDHQVLQSTNLGGREDKDSSIAAAEASSFPTELECRSSISLQPSCGSHAGFSSDTPASRGSNSRVDPAPHAQQVSDLYINVKHFGAGPNFAALPLLRISDVDSGDTGLSARQTRRSDDLPIRQSMFELSAGPHITKAMWSAAAAPAPIDDNEDQLLNSSILSAPPVPGAVIRPNRQWDFEDVLKLGTAVSNAPIIKGAEELGDGTASLRPARDGQVKETHSQPPVTSQTFFPFPRSGGPSRRYLPTKLEFDDEDRALDMFYNPKEQPQFLRNFTTPHEELSDGESLPEMFIPSKRSSESGGSKAAGH